MSGNNVFISYKYKDNNVQQLNNRPTTARNYVDLIKNMFENTDKFYFRAENDGEDLSNCSDPVIQQKLADKIFYTSITIVLITANMREMNVAEKDQWIPWEISYSLKNNSRACGESHMNAMLAVVIPDRNGDYSFAIKDNADNTMTVKTSNFFKIISKNMFNSIDKTLISKKSDGRSIWSGECSYIPIVKWLEFSTNYKYYLKKAIDCRNNWKNYNITKTLD